MLRLRVSSRLSGVYADIGVGEVLSEVDVWGRTSVVAEVLSARDCVSIVRE